MNFGRIAKTFAAGLVGTALAAAHAVAADKVTLLTSWYAQAEHGGYYQAKATGLYEKAGLDVTVRMGGPQVNGMQLLLAGEVDVMIGYDFQTLKSIEQGFPVVTVAATFQYDLQGMMTHDTIGALEDLKGKTILVSTAGRSAWWPWFKSKYNATEEQTKPYTFNLQPFFADKDTAQQGFPSSEPFQAKKQGVPVKFFLFAKYGYPPYGATLVTTRAYAEKNPDVVARLVKSTMEGWISYLADPAPGNALIKVDNPKMTDEQIAFAIDWLKANKAVTGGDAATLGAGIVTAERFKATYDYMVSAGLLKPEVDWKSAFTDKFVKGLKIGM
jgi:NitT/TauT family transport system substrate-binding protein